MLTKRDYSMTATVTENAKVGFCTAHALDLLLRQRPDLCQELLAILAERMAENQQIVKAMLGKEKPPLQQSGVVWAQSGLGLLRSFGLNFRLFNILAAESPFGDAVPIRWDVESRA